MTGGAQTYSAETAQSADPSVDAHSFRPSSDARVSHAAFCSHQNLTPKLKTDSQNLNQRKHIIFVFVSQNHATLCLYHLVTTDILCLVVVRLRGALSCFV